MAAPEQHDWHDALKASQTDEERADHRRTRRWVIGLLVFLAAWIPVVMIGFLNRS